MHDFAITNYSTLRTELTRAEIARALASGAIVRIRPGWYARQGTASELVLANRIGGRLTCVSSLRLAGVWTMPHRDLHVRVPSGGRVRPGSGAHLHWTAERLDLTVSSDPVLTSLACAVTCLDLRAAVVASDSVLNRRLVSPSEVAATLTSPRGQRVLDLVDGASESGLETLARLALRRLRIRVRSQVVIADVGRVDLLIGDRLVLELDGERWHGDFEADRSRDRKLSVLGYLVLRAGYRAVIDDWWSVEQQILELVRRDEHLWRVRHGRSRTDLST